MHSRAWMWRAVVAVLGIVVFAVLGVVVFVGLRFGGWLASTPARVESPDEGLGEQVPAGARPEGRERASSPGAGGRVERLAGHAEGDSGRLGGRVVDEAGRGVSGALVRPVTWPESRELPAVSSDASGDFVVRGLAPGGYRLRVFTGRHELFESREQSLAPGASLEGLVLVVRGGRAIEGRVVDHAGEFVVGARVGSSDPSTGIATTDAAGRFRLAGMASGDVNLFATHPGFAPARQRGVDTGRSDVTLVLEAEATLSGTIEPAPTSGSLLVSVCHHDSFFGKELCAAREVVTASEPGFVFTGLGAGEAELVLGQEGNELGRIPVALRAGVHTELGVVALEGGATRR